MIYLFKTNVLRNSNTEIKGKLSLRSSYSNDFFNMPDKIFLFAGQFDQYIENCCQHDQSNKYK